MKYQIYDHLREIKSEKSRSKPRWYKGEIMKLNQIIQVKLLLVLVLALDRNEGFLQTILTAKGFTYFSA